MTVTHFDHLYRETRHWADTVAFWQTLGFSRTEMWGEAPHRAGRLVRGDVAIVVAEVPPGAMPKASVFYGVDDVDDIGLRAGQDVVATHWGTRMVTVTDPEGHTYNFEARGQP